MSNKHDEESQGKKNSKAKKRSVPHGPKFSSLAPFTDHHRMLTVDGRLQNSTMSFYIKLFLVAPVKHPESIGLFRHFHVKVQPHGYASRSVQFVSTVFTLNVARPLLSS
ncbi:hypothetical protein FHG87_005171 [Trinorchestia longiramus]|nr:hypothetical protein FHG87_005171 [Trinorchestia longiramus]